jgi:acetyl-CoA synthetase
MEHSDDNPSIASYSALVSRCDWMLGYEILGIPRGAALNACEAVVDRQCGRGGARPALVARDYRGLRTELTFDDLLSGVSRFGGVLDALGIRKGDRVCTVLEPIPELYYSLLGTIRMGAVACPLFSGLGAQAIADRVSDSRARTVVTSARHLPKLREAIQRAPTIETILVVGDADLTGKERSFAPLLSVATAERKCEPTSPQDPLLLHYSSGTTGTPKGVLHVHEAVIAHAATARIVLDLRPEDVYWCTADPGWVTGTSYGIFGPWANAVTQVAFVGGFSSQAWYQTIQEERVTVWYTSPTALRMLMRDGAGVAAEYDLSSLRHICSVGEPLNPEVIRWGKDVYGLTIHDTWWQTETGCILIANYPFMEVRPGSMGRPFACVEAAILDPERHERVDAEHEGLLALRPAWPSMFRAYWGKEELYEAKFSKGWYITGDRAYTDRDGYFWFVSRDDDVINTSGHLVGPFEVESALLQHRSVVEAAAFSAPAKDAGEVVVAKVVLAGQETGDRSLIRDLKTIVRREVGAFAVPRDIVIVDRLPRTRSGKIMRRVARAEYLGLPTGDVSGLEDD